MMILNLKNIAIVGSSGAIGSAFAKILSYQYPGANLYTFSRKGQYFIDYTKEDSIAEAAQLASKEGLLDLIIVTNGMLHDKDIMPEKSLKDLSAEKFHRLFEVNTVVPALIIKYFLPKLNNQAPSIFAVMSARVGSISDNQLGGWYAYRAAKTALNMIIKNAAIEISRKNKQAIVIGLHPGTVDTDLSRPFHKNMSGRKLFTPEESATKLLTVLGSLTPTETGKFFAWDGAEILP
jgi:NAD(P)-dependent dehydrogenase (short-subunit alcohol dehydrogenase family)